ncbi:MAG: hypothetical protein JWP66_1845 [Naasia sp.]|nr:hypothetical protein [Naasia sp.]
MGRAFGSTVATAAVAVLLALVPPVLPSRVVPGESGAAAALALEAGCAPAAESADLDAPGAEYFDGAARGTTADDLMQFAVAYNSIRAANCLPPLPATNFVHDLCLEERLAWMAGDPSDDPASAWGHDGVARSDGVPVAGCDGNLAGGTDNTAGVLAEKWWDSPTHRASLYRPEASEGLDRVCIAFAAVHGGPPDEPRSFVRASARWTEC